MKEIDYEKLYAEEIAEELGEIEDEELITIQVPAYTVKQLMADMVRQHKIEIIEKKLVEERKFWSQGCPSNYFGEVETLKTKLRTFTDKQLSRLCAAGPDDSLFEMIASDFTRR